LITGREFDGGDDDELEDDVAQHWIGE